MMSHSFCSCSSLMTHQAFVAVHRLCIIIPELCCALQSREAELQANCDELQSQLHIANLNESWHRRAVSMAASSVAASDYAESQIDDEITDDSDGESLIISQSSTPVPSFSSGNNNNASNLSTMRRASSTSDVTAQVRSLDGMDNGSDDGQDDYSKFTPQHRVSPPPISLPPIRTACQCIRQQLCPPGMFVMPASDACLLLISCHRQYEGSRTGVM